MHAYSTAAKLNRPRGTRRRKMSNTDSILLKWISLVFLSILFLIGLFNTFMIKQINVLPNSINNDTTHDSNNSIIHTKYYRRNNIRHRRKKIVYNETAYLDIFPYRFNSTLDIENYTPKGGNRFVEWKDGDSPYIINDDVRIASDKAARIRREHVKSSMKHAWGGYKKHAFGHDEVKPISGGYNDRWTGIGTTLVDSLDTLWLMGMKDEFYEARDWVRDELNFDKDSYTSVFETTIRSLGGLLSAYDLSGDRAFLEKAHDLGKRLFKSFDTSTGIPYGEVNLYNLKGRNEDWLGNEVGLSAATTLQVEFRYLAQVTGNEEYARKAERVFEMLHDIEPSDGLYPATVVNSGQVRFGSRDSNKVSFGSRADSFYEYLLKIWLQGNMHEQMYRDMYDKSMDGMHEKLLKKGEPSGLWYIGQSTYHGSSVSPKMDHLVCFMGGLLALGAYTDKDGLHSERAQRDLKTAKALTYSCYQMYAAKATGLSPEIVSEWDSGPEATPRDSFYILRPETVESFFVLHQLTGDPIYREWGWEIFQSIEKYCKTSIAYGHHPNVDNANVGPEDNLESFFMAETLKYLYLLFDPDTEIDILRKHVFNTEAHPLKIKDSYL